jgi:hypothetical protein
MWSGAVRGSLPPRRPVPPRADEWRPRASAMPTRGSADATSDNPPPPSHGGGGGRAQVRSPGTFSRQPCWRVGLQRPRSCARQFRHPRPLGRIYRLAQPRPGPPPRTTTGFFFASIGSPAGSPLRASGVAAVDDRAGTRAEPAQCPRSSGRGRTCDGEPRRRAAATRECREAAWPPRLRSRARPPSGRQAPPVRVGTSVRRTRSAGLSAVERTG